MTRVTSIPHLYSDLAIQFRMIFLGSSVEKPATGQPAGLSQMQDDIPAAALDSNPILCRCCLQSMLTISTFPRDGPWPRAPPAGLANQSGYRKTDLFIHHNVPVSQPQD